MSNIRAFNTRRTGLFPFRIAARMSLAELQRFVHADIDRWGKLVQQAGIAGSE